MNTKRNFPWWGVALVVGCACVFCVGVLGLGGFAYFSQATSEPPISEFASPIPPIDTEQPTITIAPDVQAPNPSATTEPTVSVPSLTGSQEASEYRIYDDFSSDALDWPVFDDGKTIIKYEDGLYSFQIKEADYLDWAYMPVDFTPFEIWFDMKSVAGPQNGTAGVFCQYQDQDNYYYVEFDLGTASYVIGQFVNGENIALTPENAQGQYWQTSSALNSAPDAVNRIGIGCYQDFITLFINDVWMMEVTVQTPAETLGEAAFFVYTYPFADAEGYKVYFDNAEVYKPVQ